MYPQVFETCILSVDFTAMFGGDIVRLYPAGMAPDSPVYPYAVWQTINGTPSNYLDKAPDHDFWVVQIDVYARSLNAARDGAEIVRDAIEGACYITSFGEEIRDHETLSYRYTLNSDWFKKRG